MTPGCEALTGRESHGAGWIPGKAQVAVFVESERRDAGAHAGSEAACSSDSQAAG